MHQISSVQKMEKKKKGRQIKIKVCCITNHFNGVNNWIVIKTVAGFVCSSALVRAQQ